MEKVREENKEKDEIIASLKEEQILTRKMILELQSIVNEQKTALALPSSRRASVISAISSRRQSLMNGGSNMADELIFNSIRHIFNHHKDQKEGFKEASERNFRLEKELFAAQEELLKLKNMAIGKDRSKEQKEEELRLALDKNLDLQNELRKARDELESFKNPIDELQMNIEAGNNIKNWYYNSEEAEKSAKLYGNYNYYQICF